MILSPTRELANRTVEEFNKLALNTGLKCVVGMGGDGYRSQIRLIKEGRTFVIATPGRLIDLEKKRFINLQGFKTVVLDEVDQMLDMGFIDDIKYVVSKLGTSRQSLFFSATMSPKEETLANSLLQSPIKIELEAQSPLKTISQDIVKVTSRNQKMPILHGLLEKEEFSKVLIFSSTKIGADKISDELRQKGMKVDSLHGNKSQSKRSQILAKFKHNEIDILVATDVAARGIDVPNITHVINYDEPATYNDYIHRIGRTGRIGKKGVDLTFVVGF
ncbi:MAG TPA: DEAD/DEAH box helicase [candidate division WWE3 bacterium]|uniref:DEAD/DEAH box helicase n=1 Tax=candidate division WWE3 bacterium TaxID=2053526 RepID=A0A7C1DP75_UNCKA|nr:DEAD/DEAH box helicase [candidate division WWE3 bacterium]